MIAPTDAIENMRCILSRINNTIGRYKTLIVLAGTSLDGPKLQNQLHIIREQMIEDIRKNRDIFIDYCKSFVSDSVSTEQRELFERLYAFYLTSIEYFIQLMMKCALIICDYCNSLNQIDAYYCFSHENEILLTSTINCGTYDTPNLISGHGAWSNVSKSMKSSRKSSWETPINGGVVGSGCSTTNGSARRSLNKDKDNTGCNKEKDSSGGINAQQISFYKEDEPIRIEKDIKDLSNILNELHSSISLSHWNIVPHIHVPATENKTTTRKQSKRSTNNKDSSDEEDDIDDDDEDDDDGDEKRFSLDVPRDNKSRKSGGSPSSVSANSSSFQMTTKHTTGGKGKEATGASVGIGGSQYKSHPRLLLKNPFWNRRKKIRVAVIVSVTLIVIGVAVAVPCALYL